MLFLYLSSVQIVLPTCETSYPPAENVSKTPVQVSPCKETTLTPLEDIPVYMYNFPKLKSPFLPTPTKSLMCQMPLIVHRTPYIF